MGPEDRAGRPLARTVQSRFVVRDYLPPVVVNEFPTHGAVEIETEAPIRFEFDEPIATNRLIVRIVGPAGEVEGALTAHPGLNVAATTVVRIDDELRLETGATLENLGRRDGQNRSNIRVRSPPSLGGVVLGVSPDVVPSPGPLRLTPVPSPRLAGAVSLTGVPAVGDGRSGEWLLHWTHASGARVGIQVSEDLRDWQDLGAAEFEILEGEARVRIAPGGVERQFFRLREAGW